MPVQTVAIVGGGTMGSGIALAVAASSMRATIIDINEEQLDAARLYHKKQLDRSVAKKRITQDEADESQERISYVSQMSKASSADWAIEAATENTEIKKSLFIQMHETFEKDIVLATNTSSISITELASSVPAAADRIIGMHFFNPVPIMKLVEIIKGDKTSEETAEATISLSESMGKTPIVANDFAGFVSNRVLMPMINEAFHAWEDGVARPEDIDSIMKLGCAFPMGPLRLADYIGLDVCRDIMMVMYRGLGEDPKYLPNKKLVALVDSGNLGDKSGSGVYKYGER
ncbi:MAG: 3-hydroxyacyl-CoA dehydrogenase NAD-binding domain-containing protein [Planctomycetota bacterium]|nr:3-hydroxyacyl-CoA dehydrogenase NAD-binding domain-containing protein [Planctomycetota bacterium]